MRTTVVLAIVLGSGFAVLAVTRSSKPAVASKAPVASPAEPMLTLAKPDPRRAMPYAYETSRAAHEENVGDTNVDWDVRCDKTASRSETGLIFGSLPLFQRLYSQERIRKNPSHRESTESLK